MFFLFNNSLIYSSFTGPRTSISILSNIILFFIEDSFAIILDGKSNCIFSINRKRISLFTLNSSKIPLISKNELSNLIN